MDYKNYTCIYGASDFRNFSDWWKNNQPAYLIVYCNSGNAQLNAYFEPHTLSKGMMALISFDMFPSFSYISPDFNVSFCLFDREFGDQIFFGVPSDFFYIFYCHPIAMVEDKLTDWFRMLFKTIEDNNIKYKKEMLHNILQTIFLYSYNVWEELYGKPVKEHKMKNLEEICMKFYDLVYDNFKQHRDTSYYAEKLCISPNYLAIVLKRTTEKSPKQVIDRQVMLEIKYMLKNTTMTVAEIAHELNFPDASYLCRFFRRNTGMSVSEFRSK